MPKPRAGQSESQYMRECMADEQMKREFPNPQQRLAVCATYWKESKS